MVFYSQLHRSREESLERTNHDNGTIAFTFTDKDFSRLNWTLSAKEFRYQGEMYDVVSIKKIQGMAHVICKTDIRETFLRKFFDNFAKGSSRHNFPLQQWAGNFFHLFYPGVIRLLSPPTHFISLTFKPYIFSIPAFENTSEVPPS